MTAPALMSDQPASLRLTVPADLTSARAAAAAVRKFFSGQGVDDRELFACELCAAEACTNAIEYAAPAGGDRPVFVDAVCSATLLELRVTDHTAGFEWPPVMREPRLQSERGRGLFVIHALMDEVLYLRGVPENVLVMRRKRRGPPVECAARETSNPVADPRGHEEELRRRRFVQELEIARMIQRSLGPVSLPQVPGFGLAGSWHCAGEVGGDFYDALALDAHKLLLIVADVMGKGVPAALFATNLRGLLRGLSARFDDPAQFLGRLNGLLYEELSAVSMFITAQVAVVDVRADDHRRQRGALPLAVCCRRRRRHRIARHAGDAPRGSARYLISGEEGQLGTAGHGGAAHRRADRCAQFRR